MCNNSAVTECILPDRIARKCFRHDKNDSILLVPVPTRNECDLSCIKSIVYICMFSFVLGSGYLAMKYWIIPLKNNLLKLKCLLG